MEVQHLTVVYTCGICKTIIDEKSIPTHDCVKDYPRLFIDKNYYFYPAIDDNHIIRRSLVNNKEIVLPVRENIPEPITVFPAIVLSMSPLMAPGPRADTAGAVQLHTVQLHTPLTATGS